MDITVQAGGSLSGHIRVPGDKSISHRAIMLGALSEGQTTIRGLLEGDDVLATVNAFRSMGVEISRYEDGVYVVQGVGLNGLVDPRKYLDMGNSGTSMRLLCGILAAQKFDSVLTGDVSLSRRPMRRVTEPLQKMGAIIETENDGTPPLKISGGQILRPIEYCLPMASAQVKSAILLAGLYTDGGVVVHEPAPTRDHTERMLRGFGCQIEAHDGTIRLGHVSLGGQDIDVPSDISSAAFFIVAGLITPGSDFVIEHVGLNPTRTGILDILRMMGADIKIENHNEVGGEPVGDIRVKYSTLEGVDVPVDLVPLAIDEFPILCIAAATAQGMTRIRGAEELRHKESDRIAAMAEGLDTLGVQVETRKDGMDIIGGELNGGTVDSHHDHRIAMSFIVAGLAAKNTVLVRGCDNIATSFPNFLDIVRSQGLAVRRD
ncbi:MAG: 3-phosphoshikimate 1-carboxyvinyltransferase [Gammaproteobacteria bacterium]|nr:MAG: 3-phosphoshikimate 1-carboxyvinyltransferase [Gammaproteobacteria bacterium]